VVSSIPIERPTKAAFVAHYPSASQYNVDSYFDIIEQGYGYIAAGIADSNPYRPAFIARVRLVRAKDSSVLMQDVVVYNPVNKWDKAVTISPDPAYQYRDFDSLMADPDGAVRGLRVALEQTALTVAGLVK